MEEKLLFGALTVYRERGAFLRRLEQLEKSKNSYDEAYLNFPDDVRMLIGRSQVSTDAVQPIQAFNDADLALKLQPNNMIARNMQSRALYTLSEFEKSLVMNYRGLRRRRQPPYFTEGINQGLETVQDCVGVNSGNVMYEFLPLIRAMGDPNATHDIKKNIRVSRIPSPMKKQKLTQLEARNTLILSRVLAMKYLGPTCYDKFFLQELSEHRSIQSANAGGSKELKKIINEALETLIMRQDMLRSQRPYYSIKLAEKANSHYQNNYKEQVLLKEIEIGARTTELQLKEINKSLENNRVSDVIRRAENLQSFLDTKIPKTLPDKNIYIDRLYQAVGKAYLKQYRLSYTLSEQSNRRRVSFLMGLPVGRPKSFDSVLANYPYKFIDMKEATEKVIASLEMCENSTQRCWLMYELARLLVTQKNFALSKYYCNQCQNEAELINNANWWLNACFVLISGDMQQGNSNEVKAKACEGYEWSKKASNTVEVQAFFTKCVEMSQECVISDERKGILQREKQILGILPEQERVDTEVLFKRISTVPVGRRFAVLPSKPTNYNIIAERKKRKQLGLTVVPGKPKALTAPLKSKTRGFQIFDTTV